MQKTRLIQAMIAVWLFSAALPAEAFVAAKGKRLPKGALKTAPLPPPTPEPEPEPQPASVPAPEPPAPSTIIAAPVVEAPAPMPVNQAASNPASEEGWDAFGGGIVDGGHRLSIELDAWRQQLFILSYLYGLTPHIALGLTGSAQFVESVVTVNEGLSIGVPVLFSLANTPSMSAKVGLTPGFFHDAQGASGRATGGWLKLDVSVGFWLKKNLMMVGPIGLAQVGIGRAVDPNAAGREMQLRVPFMGGAFGEVHVTDFMAITATLMAGAMYDFATSSAGGNLLFAYRTLLGLVFQTR